MPAVTVQVQPDVLKWARQRAGLDEYSMAKYLNAKNSAEFMSWENSGEITLAKLKKIANKAYIPLGKMFLKEPPLEKLPIPDFRRKVSSRKSHASPNLIDAIYFTQFRHDWYQEKLIENNATPLSFIGQHSIKDDPIVLARLIRKKLRIGLRTDEKSFQESIRNFVNSIETAGILVMRSGVVGNNTRRKLDSEEFRGYTLFGEFAPLIFVNSIDTEAAQMFTLAHELGHVWLGQSGISNGSNNIESSIETFCNRVASEVLLPKEVFVRDWNKSMSVEMQLNNLSKKHKVSKQVLLIKALESNLIDKNIFAHYFQYQGRAGYKKRAKSSGGNYYYTQLSRLGKTFTKAVILDTYEGGTTYTDAFRLLGVKKSNTFNNFANLLQIGRG